MRACGLREILAGVACGLHQPLRGGGVPRGGGRVFTPSSEHHALLCAYRPIGIGACFKPGAAKAAAVVVGAVAQVAHVELGGVLRGGDLYCELLIGVVKQQLVVSPTAPFLAAHAQQCRGVVVVGTGSAVPHRAIAVADAVALPGGSCPLQCELATVTPL